MVDDRRRLRLLRRDVFIVERYFTSGELGLFFGARRRPGEDFQSSTILFYLLKYFTLFFATKILLNWSPRAGLIQVSRRHQVWQQ
jgi:hypothetical protein